MGRSALLFATIAAAWGGCTVVKSFAFLPGALQQASSCKPAPMRRTFARSLLMRSNEAVTESAEYFENKEALKQVCLSSITPCSCVVESFRSAAHEVPVRESQKKNRHSSSLHAQST